MTPIVSFKTLSYPNITQQIYVPIMYNIVFNIWKTISYIISFKLVQDVTLLCAKS